MTSILRVPYIFILQKAYENHLESMYWLVKRTYIVIWDSIYSDDRTICQNQQTDVLSRRGKPVVLNIITISCYYIVDDRFVAFVIYDREDVSYSVVSYRYLTGIPTFENHNILWPSRPVTGFEQFLCYKVTQFFFHLSDKQYYYVILWKYVFFLFLREVFLSFHYRIKRRTRFDMIVVSNVVVIFYALLLSLIIDIVSYSCASSLYRLRDTFYTKKQEWPHLWSR